MLSPHIRLVHLPSRLLFENDLAQICSFPFSGVEIHRRNSAPFCVVKGICIIGHHCKNALTLLSLFSQEDANIATSTMICVSNAFAFLGVVHNCPLTVHKPVPCSAHDWESCFDCRKKLFLCIPYTNPTPNCLATIGD